jgi:hypothetical protein
LKYIYSKEIIKRLHLLANDSVKVPFISKQEPCQHGHPLPNVFAHWKNIYVVEQNNSILRGLLVMKTDG